MNNLFNLKGKVALITGGNGGLGLAMAEGLAQAGSDIIIAARDQEKTAEAVSALKTHGIHAEGITVDVTQESQIRDMVSKSIDIFGKINILINNAGTNRDNLSLRMKDEEWKSVLDINLTSTFLLSKYAIKKMLRNKFGRIVNITSVVGHTGNLGQSNYAASKAGIIGMSKSLAIEYAKKNITVNCVSPGFIISDMTMNIAEKVKLYLTSRIPMGKLGTGEDVSNCVAFLSSDQSSYVTGETIHVNGGMYMS